MIYRRFPPFYNRNYYLAERNEFMSAFSKPARLNRGSIDMTLGNPMMQILRFSIPLLLGNILQQLYNTVDSMVVGNFVGSGALAAVGASGPVINLLVSFFLGISVGTGIVISQAYGAKDFERLQKAVGTVITVTILVALVLMAAGIPLSQLLLRLVNTPEDIMAESTVYMQITFGGIIFLMLFNVLSGIFQGIGDSISPFIFLVISCGINILLDLLFVIAFDWGVAGVAWATLFAQLCSVVFGLFRINRTDAPIHLYLKDLRISKELLKVILRLGIPSGFQNSLSAIGNIIVQTMLNSFGTVIIAANIAVIKIDSFCTMPMMTFGSAIAVYAGQNMGAAKPGRIKEGVRTTLIVSTAISILISAFLFFFGELPLQLFTRESAVVQAGMDKFRIVAPFYMMMGFFGILSGVVRGCGHTTAPMLIGILSMFLGRVPVAMLLSSRIGANGIHWSLSVCWTLEALVMIFYYLFGGWRKSLREPEKIKQT